MKICQTDLLVSDRLLNEKQILFQDAQDTQDFQTHLYVSRWDIQMKLKESMFPDFILNANKSEGLLHRESASCIFCFTVCWDSSR